MPTLRFKSNFTWSLVWHNRMSPSKVLCMFDYILLFSGLKLYATGNWATLILNYCFRMMSFCLLFHLAYARVSQYDPKEDFLQQLMLGTYPLVGILHQLLMLNRIELLRKIFDQIVCSLDHERRRMLRNKLLIIAILWLLSTVFHISMSAYIFMSMNIHPLSVHAITSVPPLTFWHHALGWLLHIYFFIAGNWSYIVPLTHVAFLIAIKQLDDQYFTDFFNSYQRTSYDKAVLFNSSIHLRRSINSLKRNFDDTICLLPFLVYCYLFFSTSGVIVPLLESQLTLYLAFQCTSLAILICFSVISFFVIEKMNSELFQSITEVITKTSGDLKSPLRRELIDELEKRTIVPYTAWNLFNLNKSIALSILSSLLTFSVLFIQINKGI